MIIGPIKKIYRRWVVVDMSLNSHEYCFTVVTLLMLIALSLAIVDDIDLKMSEHYIVDKDQSLQQLAEHLPLLCVESVNEKTLIMIKIRIL